MVEKWIVLHYSLKNIRGSLLVSRVSSSFSFSSSTHRYVHLPRLRTYRPCTSRASCYICLSLTHVNTAMSVSLACWHVVAQKDATCVAYCLSLAQCYHVLSTVLNNAVEILHQLSSMALLLAVLDDPSNVGPQSFEV